MNRDDIDSKKLGLTDRLNQIAQDKDKIFGELGQIIYNALQKEDDSLNDGKITLDEENRSEIREKVVKLNDYEKFIKEVEDEMAALDAIKVCPECGTALDDDVLFCANCGTRIIHENAYEGVDVCPQCGKKKTDGAVFCTYCGFKFEEEKPDIVPEAKPRTCIKCGTVLEDDVVFCYKCGARQEE